MKKVLLLAVMAILISSCESKFDKSVKCLKANIWILDSQQKFTSGNPIKKFEGIERKIHIFTENNIYVYDSNGDFENVFSYENINDKGDLKIRVENLFSHNEQEYTVVANDFMLVLIGGESGDLTRVNFELLKDDKLKSKLFQSNL